MWPYLIHTLRQDRVLREREAFMTSPMVQDAVIRNFEIIGEAVKQVSEPVREKRPDVPWRAVAGLRDILIHRYMGVDLTAVWDVIEQDLPALKRAVAEILADLQDP
ncbi:HepT-like ribonuclease domain-containing protein [Methanofollis fontis]